MFVPADAHESPSALALLDQPAHLTSKLTIHLITKCSSIPEDGVMGVMGVAIIPLALSAAICCICTAATVATGDRYADWATRACCWTSCRYEREAQHEGRGVVRKRGQRDNFRGYEKRDRQSTKNERKDVGKMEEQMNRDLITRPLRPESVG